jgi:hypothetical protein
VLVLIVASLPGFADEPKAAKPAKPTIAILVGGAKEDLGVLKETLEKLPGVKFKADDLKLADFGKGGGKFTIFLTIEIADLAKCDIGTIAKALAAANTSKMEIRPAALFLILRYKPDSTDNEKFREAIATVKGVRPDKSWVGDANIWVSVDASGAAKLADVLRVIHAAGIKIKDPIADIKD